uniref:20 kDa chaperonin, chloroplastic n=1 Tax=Pinguiococcus pyrenoidosus TaxID=172671 RepID=A0A7R9UAA2_9STRA|mmetsp:Transcript_19237/g.72656  ORF Transcript_19237/g.72656 Transcript_19237/m.72656 type:complete len:237 (+) Transcript_19237:1-711(+)
MALTPVAAFAPSARTPPRGLAVSAAETDVPPNLDGRPITSDLQPVSNFVLVKLRDAMAQTAGGIIMPETAKKRPNDGLAVAVGPGRYHPETGKLMPVSVKAGERVMYGEYMGTKIKYNEEDHVLVREDEVLLRYTGDIIKKDTVEPVGDKVLVEMTKEEKQTASGIVLSPEASKSRVCEGIILQCGPGRMSSEGETIPMPVKPDDKIKFREYGGEEVNIEGTEYMVVRANDILAKW